MAISASAIAAATPPSVTLSLRLLKRTKSVDDAIRATRSLTEHEATVGRLFSEQTVSKEPTWLGFVNAFSSNGPIELSNRSCSALLFLEIPDSASVAPLLTGANVAQIPADAPVTATVPAVTRIFALAFGGGHHALDPDAIERNFGLRVALNSIAREDLRNIDVATLDATTFQKRYQASRKSDLREFGIDTQQELFRLAGGAPTDASFARSLAGKDALTLTANLTPAGLIAKCAKALSLFTATDYKKDYGFIDHITPVRDNDRVAKLDERIFEAVETLLDGKLSDLHLMMPDIIDPEAAYEIGYFGKGLNPGKKKGFGELAIEDYVAELKAGKPEELKSIADLRGHEVRLVKNGQGNKEQARRLYDCFIFETDLDKVTHVLFAGEWYAIDTKYHTEVETDFARILASTPIIASTTAANEQDLIAELDKHAHFLNLDKVKASPFGAGGANLEPCDFLSKSKEFIHLKDGHGSAPISHLWSQGVVSAEAFVRDEVFRKSMRDSAIKRQTKAKKKGFETILPDGRTKPVPTDFKVVYGIMRHRYKRSKKLGLPFFSKVSLRAAARRIELMGFTVEVHLIEKVHASTLP